LGMAAEQAQIDLQGLAKVARPCNDRFKK